MAAHALNLNLPTTITRPAIIDEQLYQPRARLDLQARQLVEFGSLIHVYAARTAALVELDRFVQELDRVATAPAAVRLATCALARPSDVIKEGAVWSDHSLSAAFHFGGDDYDVAGAEEANLRASRSYGW